MIADNTNAREFPSSQRLIDDRIPETKFLQQSLFQVDRTGGQPDQNLSTLQWIWRDELDRGSRYDALWNIVGAVEAGAVAYLAYRHLKRYGLN